MHKNTLKAVKELIAAVESLPNNAKPVDVGRIHGLATMARINLEVYEGQPEKEESHV